MAPQMKRIRQTRPIWVGRDDLEERVIEVPAEATVTGAEDVPISTDLYDWRPAVRR